MVYRTFCPDPHNFGRRVQALYEGGRCTFLKPRTVFWEWLLFGRDSTLRNSFNVSIEGIDSRQISIADVIFGLDVDPSDFRSGKVAAVKPKTTSDSSWNEFAKFGITLAYSFAAGIQDLHFENVILTDSGPQIVDAEVIFSRLLLPNETLLLPLKDATYGICGMKSACGGIGIELAPEAASYVLSSFIQSLFAIANASESILVRLREHEKRIQETPIRVILRDTRKYRDNSRLEFDIPLMNEERIQLERGDIPYFFKFLGKDELFYYTSETWDFRQVEKVDERFQETVARSGVNPSELFSQMRIKMELISQGALYLLRHLFPAPFEGRISMPQCSAEIERETIKLITPWNTYQSRRFRKI